MAFLQQIKSNSLEKTENLVIKTLELTELDPHNRLQQVQMCRTSSLLLHNRNKTETDTFNGNNRTNLEK